MSIIPISPESSDYPPLLHDISSAPKELFALSRINLAELWQRPMVAIVGSRKVTAYGKAVTHKLAFELAQHGIIIVSGLALGTDAIAHNAALEAGGTTVAVLPSSLEKVYPATNRQLATRIIEQNGALLSEYPIGSTMAFKQNFIARNRIVSGMSNGLLITEAAEKSGTLHTARFALEQGKEVMAVPGNITSLTSAGTNNLIKSGATPVTCAEDVLFALNIQPTEQSKKTITGADEYEQAIIDLLLQGISDADELLVHSQLDPSLFGQTLTMLEITGKIRSLGNNQWSLS